MQSYICPATSTSGSVALPDDPVMFPLRPAHEDHLLASSLSHISYPDSQHTYQRETSGGRKRRREDVEHTLHTDEHADGPRGSQEGRKPPCIQCAQAGVAAQCYQNRRTIGCVRCNAQRLACSYRHGGEYTFLRSVVHGSHLIRTATVVGTVATGQDLEVPQLIRNVDTSLALLLDHSRGGQEALQLLRLHVDDRLCQTEARIQTALLSVLEELAMLKRSFSEVVSSKPDGLHIIDSYAPVSPPWGCHVGESPPPGPKACDSVLCAADPLEPARKRPRYASRGARPTSPEPEEHAPSPSRSLSPTHGPHQDSSSPGDRVCADLCGDGPRPSPVRSVAHEPHRDLTRSVSSPTLHRAASSNPRCHAASSGVLRGQWAGPRRPGEASSSCSGIALPRVPCL